MTDSRISDKKQDFTNIFNYSFSKTYTSYSTEQFIDYKEFLDDQDILFFEVINHMLYTSFELDRFFRYDLYTIKLFELVHLLPDTKFLVYVYDGITGYNSIYKKAERYSHNTGLNIPIWVFSRDKNIERKDLFPMVPDDTTFGNMRGTINHNNSSPYNIMISGIDSMYNANKKIELPFESKIDEICARFGHLRSFHSRYNDDAIQYSPRYLLSNVYRQDLRVLQGAISDGSSLDTTQCKYQLVVDGVGATYPGLLSKMMMDSVVIKVVDNDSRAKKNIVWEQWFHPVLKEYVDYIPIYTEDLPNISQIVRNSNAGELTSNKSYIRNMFSENNIDEYFTFMIREWSKRASTTNQLNHEVATGRLITEEYLKISPFYKPHIERSAFYHSYDSSNNCIPYEKAKSLKTGEKRIEIQNIQSMHSRTKDKFCKVQESHDIPYISHVIWLCSTHFNGIDNITVSTLSKNLRTLNLTNSSWQHNLWTDCELSELPQDLIRVYSSKKNTEIVFIKSHHFYNKTFKHAFTIAKDISMDYASEFLRWRILSEYGGFYAHLGTEILSATSLEILHQCCGFYISSISEIDYDKKIDLFPSTFLGGTAQSPLFVNISDMYIYNTINYYDSGKQFCSGTQVTASVLTFISHVEQVADLIFNSINNNYIYKQYNPCILPFQTTNYYKTGQDHEYKVAGRKINAISRNTLFENKISEVEDLNFGQRRINSTVKKDRNLIDNKKSIPKIVHCFYDCNITHGSEWIVKKYKEKHDFNSKLSILYSQGGVISNKVEALPFSFLDNKYLQTCSFFAMLNSGDKKHNDSFIAASIANPLVKSYMEVLTQQHTTEVKDLETDKERSFFINEYSNIENEVLYNLYVDHGYEKDSSYIVLSNVLSYNSISLSNDESCETVTNINLLDKELFYDSSVLKTSEAELKLEYINAFKDDYNINDVCPNYLGF